MYWTMCYWEVMIMTFMGFLRNWLFIRFHHCENLCWNHSGKLSNGYYALCRPVLLWIEEHMPIIYREVERRFLTDISSWRGLALCHGIGIRRSLHPRRDPVSCGSSPGAQPTDNCIGTLPTDNCPDSIPPADVNTSALPPNILSGTHPANSSTGAVATYSCSGTLHSESSPEVPRGDIGTGSPSADSGDPPTTSGSPLAVTLTGAPPTGGCDGATPPHGCCGQPMGAQSHPSSDPGDDSGYTSVPTKSRKSRKSEGAKKSGIKTIKKTAKKGKTKSHTSISKPGMSTASQPHCYEDCNLNG